MSLVSTVPDAERSGATIRLLGGPVLAVGGEVVDVPNGSRKLLAFVALADGPVDRGFAAGRLWPTVSDGRAAGNLRSALWRLRGAGIDVVEGDPVALSLAPATVVDVDLLRRWAGAVIDEDVPTVGLAAIEWRVRALDLLPGWYEDWVVFERERLRQRMLHALETLACRLLRRHRYAEAVEAALYAVAADPLRESAQRVLLTVHLAEGNLVEARRAYVQYADLLHRELGVRPGPEVSRLVSGSAPGQVLEEGRMRLGAGQPFDQDVPRRSVER